MPVYVYAIVPRSTRFRPSSSRGAPRLRVIRGASAAAIVADRVRAPAPAAAALRAHDRVVRHIARRVPAVLPVRFGAVFDDDRSVAVRLTGRTADWRRALQSVAQGEQMTLRVFGAAARPSRPPVPPRTGSGTAYLHARARELARAQTAPELDPVRARLRHLVSRERIRRHDRGALLVTAYHLIARGTAADYRRALESTRATLGVRVVASGPWPPYAFAPELGT